MPTLFLFIILCIFSAQSFAATCSDVAKELANFSSNFNLTSFQSVKWFLQTLGKPDGIDTQTTYSWGNFSIVNNTANDSRTYTGTIPPALLALKPANGIGFFPTNAQAIQVLGQPTHIKMRKSYIWNCKENLQNSVIVSVDASNNTTEYSGYCNGIPYDITSDMIKMFNVARTSPKLNASTIRPYQDQQTIALIKKEFNMTVQGHNQILPAVITILTHYYAALQSCTLGNYKYLVPLPFDALSILADRQEISAMLLPPSYIVVQATIQGFQGDKCIVKTSMILPATASPNGAAMTMIQNCQFKKTDLAVFTPSEAKFWAARNIDTRRPSAQVIDSSCILEQ